MYSVALRNGLDEHGAAEVTQTVFVALLDSLGRLEAVPGLASATVSR